MLCRICVSTHTKVVCLVNLYYGDVPASLFIKDILKIDISNNHQGNHSPLIICEACNNTLKHFQLFYQTVKQAQCKYQQINVKLEMTENVDVSQFENGIKVEIEDYVEVNNSNDIENNTSNVTDNLEWNAPLVTDFKFKNRIEQFVEKNPSSNPNVDLINIIENIDAGSQLEEENYFISSKEKTRLRIDNATNKMLAKYKIEEIFDNHEMLLNDVQKEEMLSLFVEMKCCKCNLPNFPNYKDLNEHSMKEHEDAPKLKCCGPHSYKENLQTHILYKHILKKDPPKKYTYSECPVCHKSINSRRRLVHLSTHLPHDKRDYQCDQCHAGFHSKGLLNGHMKIVHSKSEVTCDECGKTCANEHILKSHKAGVHCPLVFLCPECGKKFKTNTNLNAHLKRMHGEGKAKCHICNAVVKEQYLNKHIRNHDENNKKQCPHCPYKAFNIAFHIRTVHKKIKPFACTTCPMKFAIESGLLSHMASRHTGVPLYSCEFCEKTFMSNGNYCSHRKRRHPVEVAQKKLETINNTDKIVLVEKNKKRHIVQDDEVESVKKAITNIRIGIPMK